MFKTTLAGLTALGLLCLPSDGQTQPFGKNGVQYTNFEWHYLQSKHFDVYFYPGGEQAAGFVADVAESSYVSLSQSWDYLLQERIVIILYTSHNDFEQTNLSFGLPEESVGGFTEFHKNRIVIPYDGSYEQLRHVTHHELTHAVLLQMLFGTGAFSIISGMSRANLALWFVEGLAEYESRHGWDTESDMFMRDATLNGYLPPIHYIYGFMAYKGGQSIFHYIAERYGEPKIEELLAQTRRYKDIDQAILNCLGMSIDDLTRAWHKHLRKKYWPEVKERQEPGEFARQITFHRRERNFINNSGALSPRGDKIAYLSDKSGYFDIYLVSAIDGRQITKLVGGQRSGLLEELHWLRPGITWSPDGRQIAFAAKSREQDALHIVDVEAKKIVASFKFDLDGVFGPDWSPDGNEIAFVGTQQSASDIYVFDLQTTALRKLTSDLFSDLEPRWSPDGKQIVFISDRSHHVSAHDLPRDFKVQNTDYHQFDLYILNVSSGRITRITETEFNEKSPVWSPDGSRIAFVSDRNGIFNIYVQELVRTDLVLAALSNPERPDSTHADFAQAAFQPEATPVTNVVSGIDHLSWQDERLLFTSFHDGGFDVYMINKPLHTRPAEIELTDTEFIRRRKRERNATGPATTPRDTASAATRTNAFKNFVFGKEFRDGQPVSAFAPKPALFLRRQDYQTSTGDYKSDQYKPRFSADIITANAGYDPFFGLQGVTLVSVSDVLGNHRFNLLTDLFFDLKNSDFAFGYLYLPRQTDYSMGIYQRNYLFLSQGRFLVRDRNIGLKVQLARPFDRYSRLSYGLHLKFIFRKGLIAFGESGVKVDNDTRRVLLANIAYVKDNVLWGATGPRAGSRYKVSIVASPDLGAGGLDFRTYRLDYRTYVNFARDYTLAVRLAGGLSVGRHAQKFFIGGTPSWVNRRFRNDVFLDLTNVYFSNFVSPLRGFDYYQRVGSKFFLANLELRIPFVNYVHTTWPLPLRIRNIRGALFADMGSAWEKNFGFFAKHSGSNVRLGDVLMSFGWGARVNLGIFLLRYDMAWRTDLAGVAGARHLFSLGADF
ncbi:MAG: BamA/TamA family outer membrane protein [bacterium]